jgi:hypothetical protein
MNPDERDTRYLQFVTRRLNNQRDAEIATNLGFASPLALYRRLSEDGYPVCPECGAAPVKDIDKHCEPTAQKRERRARRGTDEAVELPPAAAAADLLRGAIERMKGNVSSLYSRKEFYRDDRFETTQHIPSASAAFRRDQFPDEETWRQKCEEYGEDPD